MGRKIPRKGGGREARKKKFRPQDPFSTRIEPVNEGVNAPPLADEDVADIPSLVGGAFMPIDPGGGAAAGSVGSAPLSKRQARKAKQKAKDRAQEAGGKANKRARERIVPEGATTSQELPKQRPGESAKAYAARVDRHMEEQLRDARRKVTTERQREKKRNRVAAKRQAKKERGDEARADAADGLFKSAERAGFGEVVQRPPILSSAAMKSRSKLKAAAAKVGAGGGSTPKPSAPSDLADYAAKVREAYAAIKKRRLEGVTAS